MKSSKILTLLLLVITFVFSRQFSSLKGFSRLIVADKVEKVSLPFRHGFLDVYGLKSSKILDPEDSTSVNVYGLKSFKILLDPEDSTSVERYWFEIL